jgi:hypothetical protein
VDHTAVARAGTHPELRESLEQKHIIPLCGKRAGNRAANHATADDYNGCFVDGYNPLADRFECVPFCTTPTMPAPLVTSRIGRPSLVGEGMSMYFYIACVQLT